MGDFNDVGRHVKTFTKVAPAQSASAEQEMSQVGAEQSRAPETREHSEKEYGFIAEQGQAQGGVDVSEALKGQQTYHDARQREEETRYVPEQEEPESVGPLFTFVNVDEDTVSSISREYKPDANTVGCIANLEMLLEYMVGIESKYHVTVSFPACGIDPYVFDEMLEYVAMLEQKNGVEDESAEGESVPQRMVAIDTRPRTPESDGAAELYEKIVVDGVNYLSCATRCLDEDYLRSVMAEATEAVFTHGEYVYTMVGPRPLVSDSADRFAGNMIETLKLNTYELSALVSYMEKVPGVNTAFGEYGGRSAITFWRK